MSWNMPRAALQVQYFFEGAQQTIVHSDGLHLSIVIPSAFILLHELS